jgi:ketosteroid isomerase-like protein
MINNKSNSAMIYKGVYKQGEINKPGDAVTFGGSLWHCNVETMEKPGDSSTDWTLAVKKGRDAKFSSVESIQNMIDDAVTAAIGKLRLTSN